MRTDEVDRYSVEESSADRARMGFTPRQVQQLDEVLGPPDRWPPGLRTILSSVMACPSPMFLAWGRDLRFLPNDAAVSAWGSLAANGIGEPLERALDRIWPQVAPLAHKAAAGVGCSADDLSLDLERPSDLGESWWHLVCSPVGHDENDTVAGLIGIMRETSGAVVLKRAREAATMQLRNALAAGDKIGAWDWDVVNNRVRSETTFALFYCVDPELAKQGVPLEEYFKCMHPDDRAIVQMQIDASIETGDTFYCEYRLLGPGGETHWISAQGKPEYDEAGNCVRFPGISFDITINKMNEARRRRAP